MTGALDEILADSRVVTASALRENHARRAREAQARHRWHARNFVLSTSIAAVAGALILYGAGGQAPTDAETLSDELFRWLAADRPRAALFGLQILALGFAAYAAYALRQTASEGEWLRERRAAELGRVELFEAIMAVAARRGAELEAVAFDHFLAAQLDAQVAYYAAAEERHRREFNRTAVAGAAIAAAAATATAAAGLSGLGGELWIAFAAGIGVVAPILANAVKSWQEATLDREKSERYRETWQTLTRLKAGAGDARRALADGDPAPARALVAQVHAVVRSENEAWKPAKIPV